MGKRYQYKTLDGIKEYVHRIIMKKHIKRDLQPGEHVYHLNGDPTDNRIENLVIIKKNIKKKILNEEAD